MLCSSMIGNNNVLHADKTIKYVPDKAVLKYQIGEAIRLREPDFLLLSEVFLGEIERKYV